MSGKMWEVDPETKQKLQEIQKKNGNNSCVDCGSPSPQWASPKFGVFMCLSCSGVHRGLGVHISFIRSITMDAFKGAELARMDAGGNVVFKQFWEEHETSTLEGRTWDDSTIRERYESEAGEEYKARLTAKIEGRDYIPGEEKKAAPTVKNSAAAARTSVEGSRSGTPTAQLSSKAAGGAAMLKSTSSGPRSASPALGTMSMGKKAQNEAYFARKGAENASRPDDLHPNQGGKFAGFGSDWQPPSRQAAAMPGADEFQKDPLAALTKGFGWFGGMVQKGVGEVSQKIATTDFQSQARALGTTVSSTVSTTLQNGSRVASTTFTKLVEGESGPGQQNRGQRGGQQGQESGPDADKLDFWDDFAAAAEQNHAQKHKAAGPDDDKLDFWDDFAAAGEQRMAAQRTVAPEKKEFWDEFAAIGSNGNAGGGSNTAIKEQSKSKSAVGTAVMSKRKPGKGDDEWGEW